MTARKLLIDGVPSRPPVPVASLDLSLKIINVYGENRRRPLTVNLVAYRFKHLTCHGKFVVKTILQITNKPM